VGEPLAVAETALFQRQASAIWSEAEYTEFVNYIAHNPEAGDVIPDTGGVRKVRWGRQGSGKRGGVRVIYFYYRTDTPLYLLMLYAKARSENLSPDEKRAMHDFAARLKRADREGKERKRP
jgi:hypothetical protein